MISSRNCGARHLSEVHFIVNAIIADEIVSDAVLKAKCGLSALILVIGIVVEDCNYLQITIESRF